MRRSRGTAVPEPRDHQLPVFAAIQSVAAGALVVTGISTAPHGEFTVASTTAACSDSEAACCSCSSRRTGARVQGARGVFQDLLPGGDERLVHQNGPGHLARVVLHRPDVAALLDRLQVLQRLGFRLLLLLGEALRASREPGIGNKGRRRLGTGDGLLEPGSSPS